MNCIDLHRFGFNGKEKDDEWTGSTGATYDYGFRIYDSRIARFLSVDPLFQSYPWYSPYQFAGNMPIAAIDLDGLEEFIVIHYYDQEKYTGSTILYVPNEDDRLLGKKGTLEVNRIESDRNLFDSGYKNATHRSIFFSTDDNGNSTARIGKYSASGSINKSHERVANIMRDKFLQGDGKPYKYLRPEPKLIQFEFDSKTRLTSEGRDAVNRFSNFLIENPDYNASLTGIASPEASYEYNMDLSEGRMNCIKGILTSTGVDVSRITGNATSESDAEEAGVTESSDESEKSSYRGVKYKYSVKRNPDYD